MASDQHDHGGKYPPARDILICSFCSRSMAITFLVCLAVHLIAMTVSAVGDETAKTPGDFEPTELAGTVVDGSGKPLAGVTVDAWSWYTGDETLTDKNGVFRFQPNSDGGRRNVEIRFSKEGYSPHYDPKQPVGISDLKITLTQKTLIEGTVTKPDGSPAASVEVRGEQRNIQADGVLIGEVATLTTTDNKGKYRLYVFPDDYVLSVADETGVATTESITVETDTSVKQDIQLDEGVQFEALVIDSQTGKPFSGLALFSWRQPKFRAVSDEEGKLKIVGLPPGEFVFNVGAGKPVKFRGIQIYRHGPLGRWWSPDAVHVHQQRSIQENGWQRNFDDLTFSLSVGMKPVKIVVEKGVVFSGHVYDPKGEPRAGAIVAPAKTGSGNSLTGDTRYSAKTKDDGSYRVVMPAGNDFQYNLIAHDGPYGKLRKWGGAITRPRATRPGMKVRGLDFKLTLGAVIRGTVTVDGDVDLSKRKVRAHNAEFLGNRYYDPTAKVNKDGTFELVGVPPGKHFVQVDPFWLQADQGPKETTKVVEVSEGEILEGIELKAAPQNR